ELLSASGYEVKQGRSDWELRPADSAPLQRQLIAGWAQAASEMNPSDSAAFAGWRDRRISHVDAGRSQIVVGHVDVAGIVNSAWRRTLPTPFSVVSTFGWTLRALHIRHLIAFVRQVCQARPTVQAHRAMTRSRTDTTRPVTSCRHTDRAAADARRTVRRDR